jgi:uncharacterized protein YgbK (DUF1537 family)
MLIGCIADDLTGATDLGVTLAREGLGVIQVNDVPGPELDVPAVDAIVVALKSRTIPAAEAIARSLAALAWLRERGARRIYFKYCSTFDSTPAGNIGPVANALLDALGETFTVATPAYPRNARTVYLGHLFVGDVLLSDSGMRDHPLTPMRDANLVRVLQQQVEGRVGLVAYATVELGREAIAGRMDEMRSSGIRYAILDSTRDEHLVALGEACRDMALTTGGAGLAMGLARALRSEARGASASIASPRDIGRSAAILAGSCSTATRAQVAAAAGTMPTLRIDPLALQSAASLAALRDAAVAAVRKDERVLVYATAEPDELARIHAALGRERSAELVEHAFREIARALAAAGVRTFVVAGGETSGAVVEALDVRALAIGREIDPGVPWTTAVGGEPFRLALKSGNFGGPDFFARALALAQT